MDDAKSGELPNQTVVCFSLSLSQYFTCYNFIDFLNRSNFSCSYWNIKNSIVVLDCDCVKFDIVTCLRLKSIHSLYSNFERYRFESFHQTFKGLYYFSFGQSVHRLPIRWFSACARLKQIIFFKTTLFQGSLIQPPLLSDSQVV